jgi:2-polyprenyl-3-methyl-5-hydroxy-6-metoxy-1,4-benzoquinol methylase
MCETIYPIIRGIPRFVSDEQDYCENFGWQWEKFRRTQIDEFNGLNESENRFRSETGWEPEELRGLLVLDGGCGAGRFSAIASQWGAKVVAVDISAAVDACGANMKELGCDVEVVQASLFNLPFRPETFDRIFSLGVVHHTPDPKLAIRTLPSLLRPGGRLAFWIYEKRWTRFLMARNLIRIVTRKLPRWANYTFSVFAVGLLFPVTAAISLVPPFRKALPLIPISSRHYWGKLSLLQQWEWTLLDTFDSYSAAYENCQEEKDVVAELTSAGMDEVLRSPARGMSIVARRSSH